ncbi:uncharacterized protein TRAVEDRAFT_52835 [Trametes versicolor FP-101664 SS1]|uniref:uncharacterized protein n=1 Tax=Trametes versicolor (strain FP-101664) TaxID=717944 RepID=UPI00046244A8|nr:uncharacterized protein TRAVEDRAFT_52835 [Trametes versicolor FP-101664 SS1]EIW53716.1 hypothetical protein TRAVEDRAFT_52835 [Trametes versicolor FP-101664 SS1]
MRLLPLEGREDLPSTDTNTFPIRLPPLDNTFGALLIGTLLGLILLGIMLHQAYRYALTFPGDSLWLKILVASMVSLEIASNGMSVHMCYYYLVTNYFHPENIAQSVWTIELSPLVGETTLIITQSYFARRLWLLGSRYRPVVVLTCVCIIAELGTIYLIPTTFALAVAVNAMLTISLICALRCKRTAFKSTNAMLDHLILYAVSTGLLNGIVDLVTTILAFATPHNLVYSILGIPGGKLYGISLLAALHSRRTVREQSETRNTESASDLVFGIGRMSPNQLNPVYLIAGDSDLIELRTLRSLPLGRITREPGLDGSVVPDGSGIVPDRDHVFV